MMMRFMKASIFLASVLLASSVHGDGDSVDKTVQAEPDGVVSVNVQRGKVKFRGWDRNEVRVVGTLDERLREFIFEERGDEVRVHVKVKESSSSWFSENETSDLTIYIPRASEIDFSGVSTDVDVREVVGVVDVGVVSGDLFLEGGTSRITVQTVSGDVELHDSEGRVRVKTVSGDVESYNTVGDASYSSISGNIVVDDGGADLNIETVSGDIEVENDGLNDVGGHSVSGDISIHGDPVAGGTIEFDAVSGTIRLRLGGDIDARFDIETGSGSIRNRLTDDEPKVSRYVGDETLRFTMGSGDGQVIVTTRSGDIGLSSR